MSTELYPTAPAYPCIECGTPIRYRHEIDHTPVYICIHCFDSAITSGRITSLPCDIDRDLECDLCHLNPINCHHLRTEKWTAARDDISQSYNPYYFDWSENDLRNAICDANNGRHWRGPCCDVGELRAELRRRGLCDRGHHETP